MLAVGAVHNAYGLEVRSTASVLEESLALPACRRRAWRRSHPLVGTPLPMIPRGDEVLELGAVNVRHRELRLHPSVEDLHPKIVYLLVTLPSGSSI